MRSSSALVLALLVPLAGCATSAPSIGSVPTGAATLEVHVLDSQGARAPWAEVKVQSSRLPGPVWLVTNDEGWVRLEHLPAGIYDVRTLGGDRVVAGVGRGQRARVALQGSVRIIGCSGRSGRALTRSLLDDDEASDFRHEPRVVHRLP